MVWATFMKIIIVLLEFQNMEVAFVGIKFEKLIQTIFNPSPRVGIQFHEVLYSQELYSV